jgi:hypothetical protein
MYAHQCKMNLFRAQPAVEFAGTVRTCNKISQHQSLVLSKSPNRLQRPLSLFINVHIRLHAAKGYIISAWVQKVAYQSSYLALFWFLNPAGLALFCDRYPADRLDCEGFSRYGEGDGVCLLFKALFDRELSW